MILIMRTKRLETLSAQTLLLTPQQHCPPIVIAVGVDNAGIFSIKLKRQCLRRIGQNNFTGKRISR